MKTIKFTTHWDALDAFHIVEFLGHLKDAIHAEYLKDIAEMFRTIEQEELSREEKCFDDNERF